MSSQAEPPQEDNTPIPVERVQIGARIEKRMAKVLKGLAEFKGITPEWLRALGGRDFTETDTLEAPGVMLINETLARRYFPNEDPIGQRFKMGGSQPPLSATNVWGQSEWSTIVGVTGNSL